MADDLKPCPFCGGTDIKANKRHNHIDAVCYSCGSLANAAIWNNRADAGFRAGVLAMREAAADTAAKAILSSMLVDGKYKDNQQNMRANINAQAAALISANAIRAIDPAELEKTK